MSGIERWGPRLALSLLPLPVVLGVSAFMLKGEIQEVDLAAIPFGLFALMGTIVAARQPKNRVGWLFTFVGLMPFVSFFASSYATRGILLETGTLPAARIAAWVSAWGWLPGVATLLTFALLLYPDGRLPSRRWRPVAYGAAAALAAAVIGIALMPGELEPFEEGGPTVANPLGMESAAAILEPVAGASLTMLSFFGLLSAASLIFRFRSAPVRQRQQIKWFAYPAAVLVVLVSFETVLQSVLGDAIEDILFFTAMALLPIGTGIGILKYRLFDIDVVINRTLVYLTLTAILVAAYLGIVVLLQQVFASLTADSDLAVAASTLAVAALFRPLRSRVQGFIDQRFYRRKYDASETLRGFSARLRDHVDLDSVNSEVLGVVNATIQPRHASLWLRPRSGL